MTGEDKDEEGKRDVKGGVQQRDGQRRRRLREAHPVDGSDWQRDKTPSGLCYASQPPILRPHSQTLSPAVKEGCG